MESSMPENKTKWYQKKRYWVWALPLIALAFSDSGEPAKEVQNTEPSAEYLEFDTEVSVEEPLQKIQPSTQQNCHPSYSGCLNSNASDYDCAGGTGNGPYYTGSVRVMGPDVFGLDRDGDGWGCE